MGKISRKENRARKIAAQILTRAKNSNRKIKARTRRAANAEAKTARLAAKGVA